MTLRSEQGILCCAGSGHATAANREVEYHMVRGIDFSRGILNRNKRAQVGERKARKKNGTETLV